MVQERTGEFERHVMLAVLRLGEAAYGAAIFDELDRRTTREMSSGAVYVALKRLEEKGLLTSRMGEPTAERGGRAKRLVSLTPSGLAHLRVAHEEWRQLTEGLGPMLEGT